MRAAGQNEQGQGKGCGKRFSCNGGGVFIRYDNAVAEAAPRDVLTERGVCIFADINGVGNKGVLSTAAAGLPELMENFGNVHVEYLLTTGLLSCFSAYNGITEPHGRTDGSLCSIRDGMKP